MQNDRRISYVGPPTGPRRGGKPASQIGRVNQNRSRSPRGDRHNDRRRERSPEYDGPRNRDKVQQSQRSRQDHDGKSNYRGRGGRRGSNASSNHDEAQARKDPHNTRAKQADQGSRAVLAVDRTPIGEQTEWDVDPAELQRVLGTSTFKSTQETKVPGNDLNYGVDKVKTTQYRQYMNRVGGFNRPLSPTRTNQFAKVADTSGIQS